MAPKIAQTGTCLLWVGQIGQNQQEMHKCMPKGFHAPPLCIGLQMHVAPLPIKSKGGAGCLAPPTAILTFMASPHWPLYWGGHSQKGGLRRSLAIESTSLLHVAANQPEKTF